MTLSAEQEQQIAALREQAVPTRRAVVTALEEILYQPLPVLDRGFVRVATRVTREQSINPPW